MSMSTPLLRDETASSVISLPVMSIASALVIFAVMQGIVLSLTGGAFEYPLDDPYIHLSIAETILAGGYGVNAGDLSSPGSSAIFPLLLMPSAGTELHRFMPLFWNLVGLTATAFLWGRLLVEAGYARHDWRWLGRAAALLGPIALMMPMVAFVGMEHSLHAAATLTVLLGLYRHAEGRGGLGLILIGVALGSALRFEALALGFLAAGLLFFSGKRGGGVVTALATLLPILAFVGFLVSLGMDPLPSSVQSKLAVTGEGAETSGALRDRLAYMSWNLTQPGGILVGLFALAGFLLWRGTALRSQPIGGLVLVVFVAAAAHLGLAQVGWLNRYEHYILLLSAAGLLLVLPKVNPGAPKALAVVGVTAVILGGIVAYRLPWHFFELPPSARAIHGQQAQMATFAKDYLKTDVAVNDLGWVAWQNPNYVLDLWGLASSEARSIRLSNPAPGWTGTLTNAHDVPVAMVYDHWFEEGIGTDWVKVGDFHLTVEGGFLGGYAVAFYATDPAHVDMLQAAVAAWEPTLLDYTRFVWAEGMAP